MAKAKHHYGGRKKSVIVCAGAGGTVLSILLDKGGSGGANVIPGPMHPSILECLMTGQPVTVTLGATKQALTNLTNYIPVTVGVGGHIVGAKVFKVNIPVSKKWNLI